MQFVTTLLGEGFNLVEIVLMALALGVVSVVGVEMSSKEPSLNAVEYAAQLLSS